MANWKAAMSAGSAEFPDFLTHYYRKHPFRSITELSPTERESVLADLATLRKLPRRLTSPFYFSERVRFEETMYDQFMAKGGAPERRRPHYLVLGESVLWAEIEPQSLRVPLAEIPSQWISFTYTDSWCAYVDQDLRGNPLPRKPQYGTVYRLDELPELFARYGWPGERWQSEPEWEHDVYVEAQVWSDEPLRRHLTTGD